MGEVRVKVRLSNVADQAAAAAGKLDPAEVRTLEADAVVDLGAVRSCVPQSLLDRLGLQPSHPDVAVNKLKRFSATVCETPTFA